jgi:putative transposase
MHRRRQTSVRYHGWPLPDFGTSGTGHLYQGRFKAFPIQKDDHFYTVMRYVERNALRANLVETAEAWRWSSLWRRTFGTEEQKLLLSDWPLPQPSRWKAHVNAAQSESEVEAVREAIRRGCPFGSPLWKKRTAGRLGLEWTLRARGRPRRDQSTAAE